MGASSLPSRLGADANSTSIQTETVASAFTIRKYGSQEVSLILLLLAIFYRIPWIKQPVVTFFMLNSLWWRVVGSLTYLMVA
jgi:hypothetical protein